jgi:hypothetical protein
MKRDMELIRKLLFNIEENHRDFSLNGIALEGYDTETLGYHCELLYEAGLVSEYNPVLTGAGLLDFFVGGITWQGHDYLELIRDDDVWEKTKAQVNERKLPKTIEYFALIAGKFAGAAASAMNS